VCVWVYSTELLLLLKEVKKKKSFGCVPEVMPCSHIVVHFYAEVTTTVCGEETEIGSSTYCVMDNRRGRTGQGRAAPFLSPSSSRITSNIAHEISKKELKLFIADCNGLGGRMLHCCWMLLQLGIEAKSINIAFISTICN